MKKTFVSHFAFAALCFVMVMIPYSTTLAASLYLDPAYHALNKGDTVIVSVRLETDKSTQECVNAVDVVLRYPNSIDPVDVSVGDSILSLWVEKPTINREEKTITFAGGIPNGYCGRVTGDPRLSNILARIVFRSPGFSIGSSADTALENSISFDDTTTAYLNDGSGTKAPLRTIGATIDLSDKPSGEGIQNPWQDEVVADNFPPEEFSIQLLHDELTFAGKHYIVFNTADKQTGIDAYYVMEEPLSELGLFQWGRADAPWIQTRSPYVLKDQTLSSVIRVKAVDKAGNEYVATLVPDESQRSITAAGFSFVLVLLVGITLIGGLSIIGYRFLKGRSQKRRERDAGESNQVLPEEHFDESQYK